jgi:rhodanese-related sulfurtransferase
MKFYSLLIILLATLIVYLPVPKTQAFQQNDKETITAEDLLAKLNKGEKILIFDVRTLGQYKASANRIKGDIRLEEEEIDTTLKNVPKDQEIVTYCTCPDEATSNYFAVKIKDRGFKKVFALKGGYYAWLRIDGPTEPK